jgi:hypothetical protein
MVHPREHQDQDAPEEWGIWDAAKIIAAAAATGAMGIALLQISRRPWGTGAAPTRATAVGGDAESLSPRHFGQLRVRAGAVGRLFASIVVATGGTAWPFFARIAGACMKLYGAVRSCMELLNGACATPAPAVAAGGAAWRYSARTVVATGGMAWRFFARIATAAATMGGDVGSLSTGHFWRFRVRAGAAQIAARTTGATAVAGAAKAEFSTANPLGTGASDGSEGGGEGNGDSGEGVGVGDFAHKSSPQQANFLAPGTAPGVGRPGL